MKHSAAAPAGNPPGFRRHASSVESLPNIPGSLLGSLTSPEAPREVQPAAALRPFRPATRAPGEHWAPPPSRGHNLSCKSTALERSAGTFASPPGHKFSHDGFDAHASIHPTRRLFGRLRFCASPPPPFERSTCGGVADKPKSRRSWTCGSTTLRPDNGSRRKPTSVPSPPQPRASPVHPGRSSRRDGSSPSSSAVNLPTSGENHITSPRRRQRPKAASTAGVSLGIRQCADCRPYPSGARFRRGARDAVQYRKTA